MGRIRKVTIDDIAKKLGVTKASISKSLNNKADVGEELKQLVKKTAEEMGYAPNSFAQKLRTKRSKTIGVFILSSADIGLVDNFATYFLDGIMKEVKMMGYDILIFSMTTDWKNEKSYKSVWDEKMVEGAIFIGMSSFDPHLDEIINADIPLSLIDFDLEGKNIFCISSENKIGTYKGTEYLWNLNHRDIMFATGSVDSPVAIERIEGYRKFMSEKNCFDEKKIIIGTFRRETGYEVAEIIMKMEKRPTAVVTSSDIQALGMISRFSDYGIRVPQDISIIGYDNIVSGAYSTPELTTIGQPSIEIGIMAARMIFDRLNGKNIVKNIKLDTSLIVRKSCKQIEL